LTVKNSLNFWLTSHKYLSTLIDVLINKAGVFGSEKNTTHYSIKEKTLKKRLQVCLFWKTIFLKNILVN